MLVFFKNLAKERLVIWNLAKNDCTARFASSGLGVIWSFLTPLMTILVFWFVFQVGFKNAPIQNVPFMVWYIPAFLSWNYFSETLIQVTSSLREYKYLVTKVNFEVSIIPLIKVISYAFIHFAFIFFIIFINLLYGQKITLYYFQSLYYFFFIFMLLSSLGWLLSSVAAFIPDVVNVIGIVIQIGFWATPIFWEPSTMNPIVQSILKLNPMFYICQGYRESFIYQVAFWERPFQTTYFWIFVLVILILGVKSFTKLRPQFDDVL